MQHHLKQHFIQIQQFFCDSDPPKEILKEMKNSDVDFSISSRILGPFVPSGWAILYNWNSRTKLLLRDWVFEMLRVGITHEDDQGRLHLALHRSVLQNRIKVRRLSSNWAFTPKCYRGNETYESYPCNIRVSVPVNSKIRITHSKDNKYCLTNGDDNNMINITRIHVQVNGKRYIVTSQDEFEEIIMPYKLPMIDWNMKNKSSNSLFWEECGNEEPFCGFSNIFPYIVQYFI